MLAASPALAGYAEEVARQLRAQGYDQVAITETLLGRARVTASGNPGSREIILNPRTGEILRDLWTSGAGTQGGIAIIDTDDSNDDQDVDDNAEDDGGKGRGRGRGGDDDKDSDNDSDKDSDKDKGSDGDSGGDGGDD